MVVENTKVSLIVPVYNVEPYLQKCIESILAQSYCDFELLLIDDGSKDKSLDICHYYSQKDERIRVISKSNGGVSSARNVGIENASGSWLTFVDSDDWLSKDYLKSMYDDVTKDVDMVCSGYEFYDPLDLFPQKKYVFKSLSKACYSKDKGIVKLFESTYWQWYVCSKLFRTSVIKEHNIRFNESLSYNEDKLFIVTYLDKINNNVSISNIPIYSYYIRPDNATSNCGRIFDDRIFSGFESSVEIFKVFNSGAFSKSVKYLSSCDLVFSYRMMKKVIKNLDKGLRQKWMCRLNNLFYDNMSVVKYYQVLLIRGASSKSKILNRIVMKYFGE